MHVCAACVMPVDCVSELLHVLQIDITARKRHVQYGQYTRYTWSGEGPVRKMGVKKAQSGVRILMRVS